MPGGGVALLEATDAINLDAIGIDDEKTGARIVLRALEEPLRQIAENAGFEGSVVVNEVRKLRGRHRPQRGHRRVRRPGRAPASSTRPWSRAPRCRTRRRSPRTSSPPRRSWPRSRTRTAAARRRHARHVGDDVRRRAQALPKDLRGPATRRALDRARTFSGTLRTPLRHRGGGGAMRRSRLVAVAAAVVGVAGFTAAATVAGDQKRDFETDLAGFEEVPCGLDGRQRAGRRGGQPAGTELRCTLHYRRPRGRACSSRTSTSARRASTAASSCSCARNLGNGPARDAAVPAAARDGRGRLTRHDVYGGRRDRRPRAPRASPRGEFARARRARCAPA